MPANDGSIVKSESPPAKPRSAQAPLQSEKYLRCIVANTPECIKVVAPDGTLLDMNCAGLRMVEAEEPGEVLGRNVYGMIAPEYREAFRAMNERVCAGHKETLEFEIIGLKGTRRRMETTAVPIPNPSGVGNAHLGVTRDITVRRQVEQALQASRTAEETRRIALETLMEAVPAIVWIAHDPECRRITGNRAGCEFLRRPPGSNLSVTAPPGERPDQFQVLKNGQPLADSELPMQKVGRTGQALYGEELEERFSDGRCRWLYGNVVPLLNADRRVSGVLATFLDITRRKDVEQRLRETEERFRSILDNSPTVIFIKDTEGRYLQVNRCHERLFHVTQEQLVGKTDFDIFPASIAQKFRENDLTVLRTGKPLEIEEIAPHDDGPHIYISTKFPLRREDGAIYAIAGIATDITERKRNELAAQQLAAIVEHSDDAIVSKDLNGIISSWNKGAERLFGYTVEEVVGKPITILMPHELMAQEAEILERVRSERIAHYETVRLRKDGSLVNISLTVSPIRDPAGKVVGASKVARDITEKVRAKEKLERTVAERTASLREAIAQMEEFSYSVSHDLRSPVRAMQGYARALIEDYGDRLDDEGREYLDRIVQGSSRMERLIHDVLTYSRVSRMDMELQPVSLANLLQGLLQQYPEFESARADILVQPDLPAVMAHEPSLGQTVANILSNAVKFVAPGVRPHVRITAGSNNGTVELRIQDNGIGIKPEHQRRLFGMFERIHPDAKYEGTGIGLAIVRKAVERMGGKVGVDSDGSNGSTFWIQLPAA